MSKYHGEQYWSHVRHQALHAWQDLSDEDFETLQAIRHSTEVRTRDQRARARRERQLDPRDKWTSKQHSPEIRHLPEIDLQPGETP